MAIKKRRATPKLLIAPLLGATLFLLQPIHAAQAADPTGTSVSGGDGNTESYTYGSVNGADTNTQGSASDTSTNTENYTYGSVDGGDSTTENYTYSSVSSGDQGTSAGGNANGGANESSGPP